MAHAQSSPRGFWAKARLDVGASSITANSTGLILPTSIYVGNAAGAKVTGNSTGVTFAGTLNTASTLSVSGQAVKGLLSANSTAIILPNSVRVGSLASYITSNSTGIKLGSLYISCNSTGNTTT